MIAPPSTIWRNWDLLTTVVVPLLARLPGGPRSWFPGDATGAVALVAAWHTAAGERPSRADPRPALTVFAPPPSDGVSPLLLRRSDLRGIPPRVRYARFHRRPEGWVPGLEITDRIRLTDPAAPVGLVAVPDGPTAEKTAERGLGRLCRGGLLLAPSTLWGALDDGRVEPVPDTPGLFRVTVDPPGLRPGGHDAGLEAESEADTLTRYQNRADLVADYSPLARSLARRISPREDLQEDLQQVAYLALIQAARRFDHRPDVSFSGYATACILGELKRWFRDKSWSVRVPRSLQETYLLVRDTTEVLAADLSRSPTVAEIATRAGITEEAVLEAMEVGSSRWARSLDAPSADHEDGLDLPVPEEGFDQALERLQVGRLARRLSHTEAFTVRRVYFDGVTQREVAADLGVSQMQVSRLLRGALEKLRS